MTTIVEETAGRQQAVQGRRDALAALGGWSPEDADPHKATPYAVLAAAGEISASREVLEQLRDVVERAAARLTPDPVEEEIKVVRGEISRTDTKASILLASVAIVAGPLAEQATAVLRQPWPVQALVAVAAVLLGVATWLLLDVVLPRFTGRTNSNFLHYARCDREALRAALGEADREGELIALSGIANAKFRCLAHAGVLLKAGGLLFVAAFVLARIV